MLTLSSGAHAQKRVVSLGGDLTEIIYALGEESRLVAADSTSVYPEAANAIPKVGYIRRLSAEGVLSVEPDLILISGAAGPKEALEQLKAAGVKMVTLPTEYTPAIVIKKVQTVAAALNVESKGDALVKTVRADIERAKKRVASLKSKPKVLFFASPPRGQPSAAGKQTAANGVIEMLGGKNVFASQIGYKPLTLESAVAADPDVILVMTHHADRVGGVNEILAHPALELTRAAKSKLVLAVDPVTVMQFGPRTPSAVADVAEEIEKLLAAKR
ncbi:MAG: hemin ABC transporter substrate-binding protein [Myxococcota bacterium]